MLVFTTPEEMLVWSRAQQKSGSSVGFVPTMGALHEGHMNLLRRSKSDHDVTVLSIFVNPTQFNSPSDYDTYPRTFDSDLELARSIGVEAVYSPKASVMYPNGFDTSIDPGSIARSMEGEFRPGHFHGVATVVVKLLQAVNPDVMYLGQKDYQQLAVLRHVISDLDIPVKIVGVPTVREEDGLAMSSRNVRLTPAHRASAPVIFSGLSACRTLFDGGERKTSELRDSVLQKLQTVQSCTIEYVSVVDAESLAPISEAVDSVVVCVAVQFGDVRLIDNIVLEVNSH